MIKYIISLHKAALFHHIVY